MALITCTECGKEFSDRAVSCPNCGCPTSEVLNDLGKTAMPQRTPQQHIPSSKTHTSTTQASDPLLSALHKKYPNYPTSAAEEYAAQKGISKSAAKKIVDEYYKTAPPVKYKGNSPKKNHSGFLKIIFIFVAIIIIFTVLVGSCGNDSEVKNVTSEVASPESNNTTSKVVESAEPADIVHDTKIFGLGEVAEYNDVQISVQKCIESKGNDWGQPESGNVFVFLNIEIANNSDEEIAISSMMSFESYCDDYKLDYSGNAFMAMSDTSKQQLDGTIAPGKKLNGYLGLEVPSDWKSLEVYYKDNVWFDSNFKFVLIKDNQ